MKRMLSMLLCLILVLGMVPVEAKAAEFVGPASERVTTMETVQVIEEVAENMYAVTEKVITKEHRIPAEVNDLPTPEAARPAVIDGNDFTTFADLKKLAKKTYSGYTQLWYVGEGPLVISENITLPESVCLYTDEEIIINKGVTFRISDFLTAKALVVKGTAYLEYSHIEDELTVTGKLYATNTIRIENGATAKVTGAENIEFAGSSYTVQFWENTESMAELKTMVAKAKAAEDPRFEYMPNLWNDFVINQSLVVPTNCYITSAGADTVTLAEGCKLTLNGMCSVQHPWIIKGNLVNNSQIRITSWDNGFYGGRMDVKSTGSYSGSGRIYINEDVDDPADVITGLDLDDFEVYRDSLNWELRYIGDLTRLAKPTGLKWGTLYNQSVWNEYTQQWEYQNLSRPGAVSWKFEKPSLNWALIRFYNGNNDLLSTFQVGYGQDAERVSHMWFCVNDPESGTYRFGVTSLGDYEKYYNSKEAKSGTWEYTKPSKKVGKCSNPKWIGWWSDYEVPADTTYVGGYEVMHFYSLTKDGTPQQIYRSWSYQGSSPAPGFGLNKWTLENYGAGYYYFKVRALSSDLTKRANGAWSEMSAAKYLAPMSLTATNRASDGKPKLTWNAVKGAASYNVYRSTGVGQTLLGNTTKTSMVNTSAKVGTKYYYQVAALDKNGVQIQYDETSDAIRCDLPRPVVKATNVASSGKIKLSWKKVEGAKEYQVYRATSKNGKYELVKTTTSTSYTNTSAKAGKTYYYKVKAIHKNTDANSAFSTVVSRMCDLKRPEISLSRNASGKPKITWEKVDGAVKYQVYRSTTGKDGSFKFLGNTAKCSYVNSGAAAGKTYYYKVRAVHSNTNANSAFSTAKYIKAK